LYFILHFSTGESAYGWLITRRFWFSDSACQLEMPRLFCPARREWGARAPITEILISSPSRPGYGHQHFYYYRIYFATLRHFFAVARALPGRQMLPRFNMRTALGSVEAISIALANSFTTIYRHWPISGFLALVDTATPHINTSCISHHDGQSGFSYRRCISHSRSYQSAELFTSPSASTSTLLSPNFK